jgi:hypothetical protein
VVAAVYAGLWGIAALFSSLVFADAAPELWQLIPPTAIMIVGGTIAAMATLDLEPINAFFHYAFYLAATVLLRVVIGLPPLGGNAAPPTPGTTATAWVAGPERAWTEVIDAPPRPYWAWHPACHPSIRQRQPEEPTARA